MTVRASLCRLALKLLSLCYQGWYATAQVLVRGLDDKLLRRLKAQARKHKRSLEAELREIIESAAQYTPAEAVEISRRLREEFKGKMFSDSADLIREDRER